jgi:glyoxylate reductase
MPDTSPRPPAPRAPRVIVTRELTDSIMTRLEDLFDTANNRGDTPMTRDQLAAAMADCDVLVPTVTDDIDAALIEGAGERLRLIANYGAGVNHIALKAARARGIIVTNTPGVLTEDTADMAMALIVSVPRRLAEGEKLVRSGEWHGWSPGGMLGRRIGGKALGIVGMGRIGQAVARRARAFGLSIHYHNRRRLPAVVEAELGATFHADLDDLLGIADIVTIHTPLNTDSHDLIDARRIGLMRRASISSTPHAAASSTRSRWSMRWRRVDLPEPASTCGSTNRGSIRACSRCPMW